MENVLDKIKRDDIQFVHLLSEDLNGVSRELMLDVDFFTKHIPLGVELFKAANAFTANGAYVPGTGIQEENDYSNGYIYPDIDTFKVLPWKSNTASVLVDFRLEPGNPDSQRFPVSARGICKRQVERLKSLGLNFYGAFEYEFYLLDEQTQEPLFSELNMCTSRLTNMAIGIARDIMQNMKKIGIKPEIFHTEYGPGQLEITQSPAFGITCPDNAFLFKLLTKEVASDQGYMATFMSKLFPQSSGSSGHFNHSLWDDHGRNLFYDKDKPLGLSDLAEHWIAGLRYHSNALICLACPTPNCYQRIIPGCFAPINNSWGLDNRTVAFRIKNADASRTYVENRMAGGSVNPYLLMVGIIIAGIDGIERKLELSINPIKGDATERKDLPEDVKPLPKSLAEALECLKSNELFVKELGPEFMQCFTAIKGFECKKADEMKEKGLIDDWYRECYLKDL